MTSIHHNIGDRPNNQPIPQPGEGSIYRGATDSRLPIPQNGTTYESTHRAPFLATEDTRARLRAASLLASPGQATMARVLDRVLGDDFHNKQARIAAEELVTDTLRSAGEPNTRPIGVPTGNVLRTGRGVHGSSSPDTRPTTGFPTSHAA